MTEHVTGRFIVIVILVALGLLVALIGTVRNITHTKGPKERRFVRRACVGTWAMFMSMLLLVGLFDPPYRYIILAMYFVIFPLTIHRWATMHQLIRHIDEMDVEHTQPDEGQSS